MAANKMAMLTEQKLKEMEAEMNRFEEEILTREGKLVPGHPRMIIGANTYNKVQAKISRHEDSADDGGSGHEYDEDSSDVPKIPISVLSAPPPPPPSLLTGNKQRPATPSLAPPPPPPPTLSFVPPQLRGHRPPPPPMPRPPMQGPPRPPPGYMGPGPFPGPHGPSYHPGPPPPPSGMPPHMMPPGGPGSGPAGHVPPPFMGHNLGPPVGGGYGVSQDGDDSSKSQATIISKPKIVYSAAPVRTVPKGSNSKEKLTTEKSDKEKTAGPSVSTDAASDKTAAVAGSTSGVVLGPAVMPPEREDSTGQMQETGEADDAGVGGKRAKKDKKKKYVRTAAGEIWEDQSLEEWETDDFRIFCGDLGNEVTDEVLARAFSKYSTFIKSKVIRDKRTNKTKGYGFVSFKDPTDFVRAMREMNGKYVGNRPIKLRKSTWKDRNIEIVRKKEKEKKRLGLR